MDVFSETEVWDLLAELLAVDVCAVLAKRDADLEAALVRVGRRLFGDVVFGT